MIFILSMKYYHDVILCIENMAKEILRDLSNTSAWPTQDIRCGNYVKKKLKSKTHTKKEIRCFLI